MWYINLCTYIHTCMYVNLVRVGIINSYTSLTDLHPVISQGGGAALPMSLLFDPRAHQCTERSAWTTRSRGWKHFNEEWKEVTWAEQTLIFNFPLEILLEEKKRKYSFFWWSVHFSVYLPTLMTSVGYDRWHVLGHPRNSLSRHSCNIARHTRPEAPAARCRAVRKAPSNTWLE